MPLNIHEKKLLAHDYHGGHTLTLQERAQYWDEITLHELEMRRISSNKLSTFLMILLFLFLCGHRRVPHSNELI